MSSVILSGDTSGTVTVSAPAISGSSVLTLPVATDTLVGKATTDTLTNKTLTAPAISSAVMTTMASSVITSGTAVASTSGTSIDFTGIPSWVKRITVMFNGVSLNGTSNFLVQIGASGTPTTSGYVGMQSYLVNDVDANSGAVTTGFGVYSRGSSSALIGHMVITNITSNTWVSSHSMSATSSTVAGGGSIALGGVLNIVRITSINGTDTFDAGSINIIYE